MIITESMKILHRLVPHKGKGKNYPSKKCDVRPNTRVLHCWTSSDTGFSEPGLGRVSAERKMSYHSGHLKEIKFLLWKQSTALQGFPVSLWYPFTSRTGRAALEQDSPAWPLDAVTWDPLLDPHPPLVFRGKWQINLGRERTLWPKREATVRSPPSLSSVQRAPGPRSRLVELYSAPDTRLGRGPVPRQPGSLPCSALAMPTWTERVLGVAVWHGQQRAPLLAPAWP